MTETKLPYSIPEMLLHLFLLTVAVMIFNPFLGMGLPDGNGFEVVRYYSLLIIEVSTIFLLITMPFPLKIKPLFFFIILLCSISNTAGVPQSLQAFIISVTKNYNAPQLEILYMYSNLMRLFPLLTYLSGYINKKLFWLVASVTIVGFSFDIIWLFILSGPLYYDHLLDNTFTR